jgi:hypothetical protein
MEEIDARLTRFEAGLGERLDALERRPGLTVEDLDSRLGALQVLPELPDAIRGEADAARAELAEIRREMGALREELGSARGVLRYVQERAAENRRKLHELRRSASYEVPFTEDEPLVTFIVPTYDRAESLRHRSIPSILAQTYPNFEIVVVGDQSPPEVAAALAEFDDARIRFHNRSIRGPYPEDPNRRWYVVGTQPYNDALSMARGLWIAGVGDDDFLRPNHTETLLAAARAGRYEHAYGRLAMRYESGEDYLIGEFPPKLGQFALQGSIYHAGLAFFELEPIDYLHGEPNDFSLCRRMIEAGVRFGMVEDVLVDKYETRYHSPEEWRHGAPSID